MKVLERIHDIPMCLCKVPGMQVNNGKYSLLITRLEERDQSFIGTYFPYLVSQFDDGLK